MRRGAILRPLLKGVAGFLLGFAIWGGLTLPYNRLLAATAERAIHAFESPNRTDLRPKGKEVLVYRSDVPAGSARPGIPVYDLTFNVILLTVLFAVDRRPLANRNAAAYGAALLILFPTHVLALVAWTQDLYATRFGAISDRYSPFERSLWANAIYFYRLLGQFAIPLVLRWLLGSDPAGALETSEPGRRKRPRRRQA